MTIDPAYIARQLREWRQLMHLTQENVATACGIALRTVEKLESGRHKPSEQTLRSLCRGLSMNRTYFIEPSPQQAAEHEAAILKALRTTAVVRTHIVRTAKDVLSSIDGFHAWNCDFDLVDEPALAAAAGFIQQMTEWGEVWREVTMPDRLEAAKVLAETCQELKALGYLVHMGQYRAVRHYPSGPPLNFVIGLLSIRPKATTETQSVALVQLEEGWEVPTTDVPSVPLDLI